MAQTPPRSKACTPSYVAVQPGIRAGIAALAPAGGPSGRQDHTPSANAPHVPAVHEIHVAVVSPEEAAYGTAEFWAGGRMIAFTRIEDGDLVLRIDPSRDGTAVVLGARSLAAALAEANRLLAVY
jgi:hypothetical protein